MAIFNGKQEDFPNTNDNDRKKEILSKIEDSAPKEVIKSGVSNIMVHLKDCDKATKNLSKIISANMNR